MPLRWEYIYITSILATILLFLSFIHCKNSLLTPTYSSVNFFYVKIMKYMTLRYIELHRTNRTIILNITETKKKKTITTELKRACPKMVNNRFVVLSLVLSMFFYYVLVFLIKNLYTIYNVFSYLDYLSKKIEASSKSWFTLVTWLSFVSI